MDSTNIDEYWLYYTEGGMESPGVIDWFEFLEGFYDDEFWVED